MAKTQPAESREVFTPIDSFTAEVDGVPTPFVRGETRVRAGHPILVKYGHLFEPMRVQYDVEQATDAPGERRG